MKKRISLIPVLFIGLLISALSTSCSEDSTEPEKSELNIGTTAFTFTKNVITRSLVISNNGAGELTWEVSEKPDWLNFSKNSGNITSSDETITMNANTSQEKGTYSGLVKITSNGGDKEINTTLELETWITRASMPTARKNFAACVFEDQIYAIGGWDGTNSFDVVEVYDPATNKWSNRSPLINAMDGLSACVLDGKIYAIGGASRWTEIKSTVQIYDPANDSWSSGVPLPRKLHRSSSCVVNGKIYVIGGRSSTAEIGSDHPMYVFDPSSGQWTEKSEMPTLRSQNGACVVEGIIYIFGGGTSATISNDVEAYNPNTDSWETKNNMILPKTDFGACILGGKIYAIGGFANPDVVLNTNYEYNPVTDSWSVSASLPTSRWGLSANAVNGQIFLIGGTTSPYLGGDPTSIVEAFDP